MGFEDDNIMLCANITTDVTCAVGFQFEILLNLTEGISQNPNPMLIDS